MDISLFLFVLDYTCNRWIGNNKHGECLMHDPHTLSLNLNLLTAGKYNKQQSRHKLSIAGLPKQGGTGA